MRHRVYRRVGGVVGTCRRKPQTMLEITQILSVSLDFFNKTWNYANFD
jgi:hypothetical protein